jgi:hypothetical protein
MSASAAWHVECLTDVTVRVRIARRVSDARRVPHFASCVLHFASIDDEDDLAFSSPIDDAYNSDARPCDRAALLGPVNKQLLRSLLADRS